MIENLLEIIEIYPLMGYIFIFFLAAIIGSFLNVVIYRYPIMIQYEYAEIIKENSNNYSKEVEEILKNGKDLNLSFPSSHCFHCKEKIKWYNNIPILSYLLLKGRCFNCKEKYSSRYFFIELIHSISWVLLFYKFGISITFLITAISFSLLLTMSMIDFDHKILPDGLVFSLMGLGLLYSTTKSAIIDSESAILQSIIGFLICHTFISVYSKIRGKLMMGFGDIKLMTAILTFIPFINVIYGFLIASLSGILFYVFLKVFNKLDEDKTMPFGPFISLGFFIQFILYLN
jgi:leader peptidase (prepilin peptidase)/N-methyltransferase